MAIPLSKPLNVETNISGPSTKMSIDTSTSHIFELLSEKLYSNPIGSVCREITCNARDAHRAAKITTPVRIVLPGDAYIVKDFGVGMSPETINDVYSVYGKSSKRESNDETGMFGIGAKSPFSVTSQYTVITNWGGIEYTYLCFKDHDRIGKIKLVKKEESHEQGTTVKIPVKYDDKKKFEKETLYYTRFWDVKPDIAGQFVDDLTYPKFTLEGTKWKYSPSEQSTVVFDGIPYPLKWTNGVCFFFNIGEVEVTPNREELLLNDFTSKAINEQKLTFTNEYKQIFEKTLAACKTFKEAWDCVMTQEIMPGQTFKWKTHDISKRAMPMYYLHMRTERRSGHRRISENRHLYNDIYQHPVFYFDYTIEEDAYNRKEIKLTNGQRSKFSKYFKLNNVTEAFIFHSDQKYLFENGDGTNSGTDINNQKVKGYKPVKRADKLRCLKLMPRYKARKVTLPWKATSLQYYTTLPISTYGSTWTTVYQIEEADVPKLVNDGDDKKWVDYKTMVMDELSKIPAEELGELAADQNREWDDFSYNKEYLGFVKEIKQHYKLVEQYTSIINLVNLAICNKWIKSTPCPIYTKYPILQVVDMGAIYRNGNAKVLKEVFKKLYP